MSLPSITIVTPCLNSRRYIKSTIESVLGQGYPELEYWIFDAGSTDGTLEIIQSYGERIHLVVEPDRGQSHAINKGFRRATRSIVSWINSNDVYLPGSFQAVAEYFQIHPEAGMIFGKARYLGEHNEDLGEYEHAAVEELLGLNTITTGHFERLLNHHSGWIPQQTAFWRRSLMEQVGYLDEGLHYAMDYEYWLRLGEAGSIHFVDQTLGGFRLHDDAKSLSASRLWKEVLTVNRRYGGKMFSPLHKKFLQACVHAAGKRIGLVKND